MVTTGSSAPTGQARQSLYVTKASVTELTIIETITVHVNVGSDRHETRS